MDILKDEFSNALLGRFRLRFRSKKLETSFLDDFRKFWYRQTTRSYQMLIVAVSAIYAVFKFILNDSFIMRIESIMVGVLGVSFLSLLLLHLWPKKNSDWIGKLEIVTDIANILFGLFYLAFLIPEAAIIGLPVDFFCQTDLIYVPLIFLIGHIMTNFIFIPNRYIHSLIVGAFIVAISIIVIIFFSVLSTIHQAIFIGSLSLTLTMLLQSGFQKERNSRETFYQWMLVEQQKRELAVEREKSESLLLNILPAPIAERLKKSPETIADAYPETTVLFSDIVGFTKMSQTLKPGELVKLLNDLFSRYDDLVEKHGLEKIKTIGDAYMIAAGIPEYRWDHAEAMADMALDMRKVMVQLNKNMKNSLSIRIGINTGPVVAGVIGKKKFTYDLWGDAVNTAARMESHGVPGEIQVSASTYELLKDKYKFESRGKIEIKSKGLMEVWLLKEPI